jgi:hypothetical protein
MLNLAIENNISVEAMEKLVTLHERVADRYAASEFASAMASFQDECPSIGKKSTAHITTQSGIKFHYSYADLDTIISTIRPILHKCGLSYTWDSTEDADTIKCVCKIQHINGHSQTATFQAPVDRRTKATSAAQQNAAALSYARRQSLVQALGLTTCDPDTDANIGSAETITEKQIADIDALASEVGANKPRFLKHLDVEKFSEIRADQYSYAIKELERKR